MGQYYVVANMDKKERLVVKDGDLGGKLLEISQIRVGTIAILNQIAGAWKGDHVYVVGDYAEPKHAMHQYYQALQEWTDRLHVTDSLYDFVKEEFQAVEGDTQDYGYRFIYNHAKKEYIDLAHCPHCCEGIDWRLEYIAPLPLLIAMGNGLGGGD